MAINLDKLQELQSTCKDHGAVLVAVSKIKPVSDIRTLYEAGQLDFGENYVQELVDKQGQLPADIRWHFIGHLQSNKVRYIAPFVHLVHGVDSPKLLKEISKQGRKLGRVIDCLLQVHIAQEETKFGLNAAELKDLLAEVRNDPEAFAFARVRGLMGMASFSDDDSLVRSEFRLLRALFEECRSTQDPATFSILSMGMSGDYRMALEEGSTMVRIGSLLFGARI